MGDKRGMTRYAVRRAWLFLAFFLLGGVAGGAQARKGFVRIFDGRTLTDWTQVGGATDEYVAENGVLTCKSRTGANLYWMPEVSDFVFRFDFKLSPAGNNGIGIRAPLEGDAAYVGMECQVLDDSSPDYANLEPGQYHSSLYKIVAARRGSLKPVGAWNHEEIRAIGRHVRVVVNGMVTVNVDLNTVYAPEILAVHPGMLRDRGHIGFLGHGPSPVYFRNVFLHDLSKPERENTPPTGFVALFNGKNLHGWKGLVADPPTRAKMTPDALAQAQAKSTLEAKNHWTVLNGEIVYDGKNNNLCTARDYGNFEMLVDWKIPPAGDSGIYLRGSPQVQIWDADHHPNRNAKEIGEGSGGLYNNEKNTTHPLVRADNPTGQWNRFRILMVGDKVTVYLNNKLVVPNVTMENYWERGKPLYPVGQIELQHHGGPLWFKNIYLRELP